MLKKRSKPENCGRMSLALAVQWVRPPSPLNSSSEWGRGGGGGG